MKLSRRCAISADKTTYANQWHAESEALVAARQRANEIHVISPSPAAAALLSVLVASTGAKAVVEVGTGSGITGLAIFAGMSDDGVLTTIDADGHHQAAAKEAFAVGGHDGSGARLITGIASEVLPRLADGAYDAVVLNAIDEDPLPFIEQATRLLRSGGAVIFTNALGDDSIAADPAARDPRTNALRAAADAVQADETLTSALLPIDNGILIAVKA